MPIEPASENATCEEASALAASGHAAATEGHFAAAIDFYRRALAISPERIDVHNNLAALLLHTGDIDAAVGLLQAALALDPGSAATWLNLAIVLQSAGDLAAAAEAQRLAIAIEPDRAEAHYSLSGLLQTLGRVDEATVAAGRAVELRPDWAPAHNRLGTLLQGCGRDAEALAAFRRAAEAEPAWHLPCHNLGQMTMQRSPAEAIACFRAAIERAPDFAPAHLDLGALLLASGAYAEGWRELEWRFAAGGRTPGHPSHSAPVWDGSPLAGQTVMVWIEQGLGDHIQFARYVRAIRQRGGRVWLQTPKPLLRLYATLDGVDRLIPEDATEEEIGGFDFQIPIVSLARIFGTTLDSVPAAIPYLAVPADAEAACRASWPAAEEGLLKIGIVWASRPGGPAGERRDCDVEHFARLARLPGIALYSLQFGERAGDLAAHSGSGITDLSAAIGDFATTAAFVRAMDLVITVDTAMAHLAGALGQRVWTLLSEPADWRWLTARGDSPWYPTMTLFRQSRPGEWEEVFAAVERALRQEMSLDAGPGSTGSSASCASRSASSRQSGS
ncbi:MAG TPA: tetratricopeptide repeat protein [Thermoanaerobaculia bacterium]|nr:tetratricopeptide repeat protein [Thermoanaerobaculia bacterium]